MKPSTFVWLFERRKGKRPTEVAGLSWHEAGDQSRMCVVCTRVMFPGTGELIEKKWCGRCWRDLHPDTTDVPPAAA